MPVHYPASPQARDHEGLMADGPGTCGQRILVRIGPSTIGHWELVVGHSRGELEMGAKALGHVVLRVRDLKRSLAFYRDTLGLKEVARYGARMVFLSCGENHHDLALQQIGKSAPDPNPAALCFY